MFRSTFSTYATDSSNNNKGNKKKDFTKVYHADRNESPEGVTMKATVNGEGRASLPKSDIEQCLDWIYDCQSNVEKSLYGNNKEAVQMALQRENSRAQEIEEYADVMNKHLKKASSEDAMKVRSAYAKLQDISKKKICCLETMYDVASLQQLCVSLSRKVDLKALSLVDFGQKDMDKLGENMFGFLAPSAQDCIFATKDNWDWNVNVLKCMETHMRNASDYHQFFHEVEETSVWLSEDLKRIHASYQLSPLTGDYTDAQRLHEEIQDTITALRQWQTKTEFMWAKGLKVVPVYKRTNPLKESTPARAITDYKTDNLAIRTEEDLLVLDNTDEQLWKVRNSKGQEGLVPPVAVVIPGPTKEAIEAAMRMRLQLLAAWTNALKVIGRRLIVLMLLVFKPHYEDDELTVMRSIGMMDRQDLLRILDYIENTLKTHWSEHEGFHNLQERILMLRMILDQCDDQALQDPETYRSIVVQIATLENLMKKYQEMWREWEKFKVALETSRAPELMLICDKLEQLKFVTRQSFARFWQHQLPFTEEEKRLIALGSINGHNGLDGHNGQDGHHGLDEIERIIGDSLEQNIVSATALKTATIVNGRGVHGLASVEENVFDDVESSGAGYEQVKIRGVSEGGELGYATETKTAKTEQLSSVEGEESKKFVIRSVLDPRSNTEISLKDAVEQGIIRPDEGSYCDLKTGECMPIPAAMNAGLIQVMFTTTNRAKEKRSSVGIITIKTIRTPLQPYTILSVKDTRQDKLIDPEIAIEKGIINAELGVYKDTMTGREMLIVDAAKQGFVQIEYEGPVDTPEDDGPKPEPEVEACTYAIRAVVDRMTKKTISFSEAVSRGIIDKDSGAYYDNSTGKTMYIGDAIVRGFLKARKLDDPSSMDIEPENKLVVDKTEKNKGRSNPSGLKPERDWNSNAIPEEL